MRASSFQIAECGDPKCGPHFIGFDRHGSPICEIVIAKEYTLDVINTLRGILYGKAVESDDEGQTP